MDYAILDFSKFILDTTLYDIMLYADASYSE